MFLRFGRFHGDNQVYGMSGTMQQKIQRTCEGGVIVG